MDIIKQIKQKILIGKLNKFNDYRSLKHLTQNIKFKYEDNYTSIIFDYVFVLSVTKTAVFTISLYGDLDDLHVNKKTIKQIYKKIYTKEIQFSIFHEYVSTVMNFI